MKKLKEKVRRLPRRPGVYLFEDGEGRVLYVGKAVDLRARVRTYFSGGKGDGRPRIPALVQAVRDLDFMVTGTEKEALILENTLIKKHRPPFNVTYRDDKTYTSIRINLKKKFPRIQVTRHRARDGALYFGPFASKQALKETLRAVRSVFPLRHCTDTTFKRRTRPCIYHEIGQCLAPCVGKVGEEEYGRTVEGAVLFLRGRKQEVVRTLETRMAEASEALDFERAALLRDQLAAIRRTLERQDVVDSRVEDRDIAGWTRAGTRLAIQIMLVRGGRLSGSQSHVFDRCSLPTGELVLSFFNQFYAVAGREIPPEVILAGRLSGWQALEEHLTDLRGRRVRMAFPRRGSKARLARLARDNARWALQADRERPEGAELLGEVAAELDLEEPPEQIECYDVSCIMGVSAVASMVTFRGGKPDKSGYRRFRIRRSETPDDYAMLREVLERRIRRAALGEPGWDLPDMILIDGGKGHLGVARAVLDEMGMEGPLVASIAKGRDRKKRKKSAGAVGDRIFHEGSADPLELDDASPALRLCRQLRDEAHRFAISYFRKVHRKRTVKSVLEEIPGVGPARRKSLLTHFGSFRALSRATEDEIAGVKGLPGTLAADIRRRLRDPAAPGDEEEAHQGE